ncbi:transcriptional regulator [Neisseria sp. Ec49-e6-T10]|uniref:transcriptional regulator n=1 Tax=Neisseria sp. Ec49-e6-T10 TaxID=3140744 RepID=UPI003EBB3E86
MMINEEKESALEKAISYFGSQAALGRKLGVERATVNSWYKERNKIPAHIAVSIEKITNGTVSREDVRPDLFIK